MPGSVVICVSGRWCHFQGGMPRPVVHAPIPWLHPHVKTVPIKAALQINDMAMENMHCKNHCFCSASFIFCNSLFFFAKLLFFLQYFIFFCNSVFLFTKITFIFLNTSFSFVKLYFLLLNFIILHIYVALNWFHSFQCFVCSRLGCDGMFLKVKLLSCPQMIMKGFCESCPSLNVEMLTYFSCVNCWDELSFRVMMSLACHMPVQVFACQGSGNIPDFKVWDSSNEQFKLKGRQSDILWYMRQIYDYK